MPKIRIKRVTESYLQQFAAKSYNTVNGITTFTTSGALNTNFKKFLTKKHNVAGKYFKINTHSSQGNNTESNDPYYDQYTIDFVETDKNNSLLNVPLIKIQNQNDYYITSDSGLLSQSQIQDSNLRQNMKVSDSLISKPNFIDLERFTETGIANKEILSQTREFVKEDNFTPFVEEDIYEGVDSEFISESILYDNEEYDLGEQQKIEIELDFTESSDAFLLNTQLFYKNNNFFTTTELPTATSPLIPFDAAQKHDITYVSDQVNFLKGTPTAITSQFLPNAIWNDSNKRWEFNIIDIDELDNKPNIKTSPYRYNKNLVDNNSYYHYPNFLTHAYGTYEDATVSGDRNLTNQMLFDHFKYIKTSPICFSSFYDRKNSLNKNNKKYINHNRPTSTYGFPNSQIWKTNKDHSINLNKYLTGDFLLEKVIFDGSIDVKAEVPTKKGNIVNHLQIGNNTTGASHDGQLFDDNIEFNESFILNENTSDYIVSGINFYLINKTKNKKDINVPEITGFIYKKENDSILFEDFTLSSNNQQYPYIDTTLSDLSGHKKINDMSGNFNEKIYTVTGIPAVFNHINKLIVEPVRSTTYTFLNKDEFNNISDDRLTNNFYYLDNAFSFDPETEDCFFIKEENIDYDTKIIFDGNNTLSKVINKSTTSSEENVINSLITQNSISFIKIKNSIQSDLIETESLNSKITETLPASNDDLFIDIKNYKFKLYDTVKSIKNGDLLGEESFSIKSNYNYPNPNPEIQLQDELYIIEEGLGKSEKEFEILSINNSDQTRDIVSESGKSYINNLPEKSTYQKGYLLKKEDSIAIGINSFTGFNNIISYVRLKDRLKVTLIGKELHKKSKNESFESKSIKKAFVGNQTKETFLEKRKNGKYFTKSSENNSNNISDSIFPSVSEIYYDLAGKQVENSFTTDTLDWFLSLNVYDNFKENPQKTNKIIFSNKNYSESESKYDNILNDWHNTFYLSKFKENSIVATKQIKSNSAILKDKNIDKESYLYFDINSYSLQRQYDMATAHKFDNIFFNAGTYSVSQTIDDPNNQFQFSYNYLINQYTSPTIRKFLFPIENNIGVKYEQAGGGTPLSHSREEFSHPGIPFRYNNNENFNITKDTLLLEKENAQEDIIFSLKDHSAKPDVVNLATFQYLSTPSIIYSFYNQEGSNTNLNYHNTSVKSNHFKNNWVLVIENYTGSGQSGPKFSDLFKDNILDYLNHKEKLDFYLKVDNNEIFFDETFNLKMKHDNSVFNLYRNKFYVVYNEIDDDIFICIPLTFMTTDDSNSSVYDTTNTINNINNVLIRNDWFTKSNEISALANYIFKIEDSEVAGSSEPKMLYTKIPKSYLDIVVNFGDSYTFDEIYKNGNTSLFNGTDIDFYINKYNLKFPINNDIEITTGLTSTSILEKNQIKKEYKINNLDFFELVDKKAYGLNTDYFNDRANVINNTLEKRINLNKPVHFGLIYKKVGNTFVKTNNRVLFEVVNIEHYPHLIPSNDPTIGLIPTSESVVNTYINIIGLTNKDKKYLPNNFSSLLMYDIDKNDIIRIYDEKLQRLNNVYEVNFKVPYVEINLSSENGLISGLPDLNSKVSNIAIKYSHYASDNYDDETATSVIKNYGSPIAHVDDNQNVMNFLYAYSRNKKFNFPVDQTSGYRYGVYSPTPVKPNYYFNTNHYGQFKDKNYSTQSYSSVTNVNGQIKEIHCVEKKYVDDTFTVITATEAAARPLFAGSNIDNYDRVYHPYIESKDGSDMSYLYT